MMLLLVLLCIGAAAQESTDEPTPPPNPLLDALWFDGRFTFLVEALESEAFAPDLLTDGSYTLFAPTDDAFANALQFLGMTREQLLADAETLRALLLSHIAPGRVWFRTLAVGAEVEMLSGEVFPTALADGRLRVGEVFASSVDRIAGDDVFHVLDRVLLPPAALMPASLRFAHFSPDAPAFDVQIDGALSGFQNIGYPAITGWLALDPGVYTLTLTPTGDPDGEPLIIPATFSLRPRAYITLALVGSVADGTLFPLLIDDSEQPLEEGYTRLTVIHAIEDAPALDFRLDGSVFISRLAYPYTLDDNDGYFTFDKLPDTYQIDMRNYGNTTPLLLQLPEVELLPDTRYIFAAIGTLDAPSLVMAVEPPRP